MTLDIPIGVGDRIVLYENVDLDDGGAAIDLLFEDYVDQYVPETGLLTFEESDIQRAKFLSLIDQSAGIEIIRDY